MAEPRASAHRPARGPSRRGARGAGRGAPPDQPPRMAIRTSQWVVVYWLAKKGWSALTTPDRAGLSR